MLWPAVYTGSAGGGMFEVSICATTTQLSLCCHYAYALIVYKHKRCCQHSSRKKFISTVTCSHPITTTTLVWFLILQPLAGHLAMDLLQRESPSGAAAHSTEKLGNIDDADFIESENKSFEWSIHDVAPFEGPPGQDDPKVNDPEPVAAGKQKSKVL